MHAMIHLRSLSYNPDDEPPAQFPWSVPAIRALAGTTLEFSSDVTFLIGENGSGKSTLLEALAYAARMIAVGSDDIERDRTLSALHSFAKRLKLSWSKRTHRGFFLRSEDFFGYARRVQRMREEAEADLRAIQENPRMSELARGLASQPHARTIADLTQRYGAGLDAVSHGESYFALFRSRLVPNGLYLLDEPEAPLSPMRQIGLMTLMKTLVEEQQAQFIIATHSPILMAFPNAQILSFDHGRIAPVPYDDIEHVTLTREFLANPQRFLRHL